MNYKELKYIAEGLIKADALALRKMETVDALSNIDRIEVTDDNIDLVCDIIDTQYHEYLNKKWAKGDIYDFTYAINACFEDMDEVEENPVVLLHKIDWDKVFDYTSEMD